MKLKWELVCAIKEIDVEEVIQFDFEKKHLQFIIPLQDIMLLQVIVLMSQFIWEMD